MSRDAVRPVPPRTDPELSIARDVRPARPRARSRSPGSASVSPDATDAAIDAALGPGGPPAVTADASASLPGCLQCHAASAADGESRDRVAHAVRRRRRPVGAVRRRRSRSRSSHMDLQVVADGRHSVPTSIELAGRRRGARAHAPADRRSARPRTRPRTVPLHFPALTGRADPRRRSPACARSSRRASRRATRSRRRSAIAELGIPGLRVAPRPSALTGALPLRPARDRRPAGAGARRPGRTSAASQIDGLAVDAVRSSRSGPRADDHARRAART